MVEQCGVAAVYVESQGHPAVELMFYALAL